MYSDKDSNVDAHALHKALIAANPNPNPYLSPFNSKTTSLVGYYPYIKSEHFGIIRFWVMQRTIVWKCTHWPCDLDLWPFNPKTIILVGIPRSFIPSLNIFGSFVFELCSGQTDKQNANKQTDSNMLPTPTDRVIDVCNEILQILRVTVKMWNANL